MYLVRFLDGPLADQTRMTDTMEWPLPEKLVVIELREVLGPGEYRFFDLEACKPDQKEKVVNELADAIYKKVGESDLPADVDAHPNVMRGARYEVERVNA